MNDMAGKVCIITGAASGIGCATAKLLAQHGASVVLSDKNLSGVAVVVDEMRKAGQSALAVEADVTNGRSVATLIERALKITGRIDVLVNNAGILIGGGAENTSEEDWDLVMNVNVKGVFLGCKHVLPVMRAQRAGSIINMSSVAAIKGTPSRAAYVASKGAVAALTRSLAIDHAQENIRINSVAPGSVKTPIFDRVISEHPDPTAYADELRRRQPMNRMGRPEEIAAGILFLASDASSFVTGSMLTLDGGLSVK